MRAYAQETAPEAPAPPEDTVTVELPASAVEDPADDVPEQIDVDPDALIERVDTWVDGAVRLLPNIIVALVFVAIVTLIAIGLGRLVRSRLRARGRRDLGIMAGGMVKWALILVAVLFGLTIVLPTLRPGDLVAGLGIGSVAIGFAFKDILQNWLSGLLLLLRQPFGIGDQVVIGDYEGTVERIETRSTIIRTYDGQRGIIPNGEVYTSALKVRTASPLRRSQYDIGIGYGDGIGHAIDVLTEALRGVEGVEADPGPEALVWDLSASWVSIRMRWWTASDRATEVRVWSRVLWAAKEALDAHAIDMPYDTQVQLFHDQTEEVDGDRTRQREGWPSGDKPPRSRRDADREDAADKDQAGG